MKLLAFVFLLLLTACGTPRHDTALPASTQISAASTYPNDARTRGDDARMEMNNLAIYAMSLADTPYQYGGKSRDNGFDCSGFVQFVFQNSLGLQLPRTSSEMSRLGIAPESGKLKPGDLVFFKTTRTPFSHVGIFIGEDRFVHSPSAGKAIMITSLHDQYWRSRYNGARRIASNK